MKSCIKTLIASVLLIATNNMANANIYVGAKALTFTDESIRIEKTNITSKSKLGYGLFAGFKMQNNLGVEVDYIEDGTILDIPSEIIDSAVESIFNLKDPRVTGRWQYGAYATYHFLPSNQENLFVKGKLGYVKSVVELNNEKEFKENGVGLGVGLDYKLSDYAMLELSYDYSDVENTQSKLGLGLAYVFK